MLTIRQFLNQKRDYSDLLVHLTRSKDNRTAVEVLLQILRDREIKAFESHCLFNERIEELPQNWWGRFEVACFSECPLPFIRDITTEVSGRNVQLEPYGIFVNKDTVTESQGNPVMYASRPAYTNFHKAWDTLVREEQWSVLADIMPFVSMIKEGNDFHWEREWRVPRGLAISPQKARFIVCAEQDIEWLRDQLIDPQERDWLAVPIIDAMWSPERIVDEVAKLGGER